MPEALETLTVTPVTPLVNLDTLIDATVQVQLFDDPVFKHERYIGTIDEVKISRLGTFARVKVISGPSHITGMKWISIRNIKGFVTTTQKTAA